jgi:hypothetical protein
VADPRYPVCSREIEAPNATAGDLTVVKRGRYMMEINETPKAPRMKLVAGLCALAASLGAALLWKSGGIGALPPVGVVTGVGVVAIGVTGVVAMWLRNRRRRVLRDMRDSALW